LELCKAETPSFIGVVLAPYLVRKSSELLRLDVRVELNVQRASLGSVTPSFAWRLILFSGGRSEQSPEFALALSDEQ
jgi:hypothetical protein